MSVVASEYAEHGQYKGDTSEGLRHGRGQYTFANAFFSYNGQWYNGVMHGEGALSMRDGGEYEGQFVNGAMTGQGMRRFADGATYSGQFEEGELHGEGTYISSEGEQYEGSYARNARHGTGKLTTSSGDVYEVRPPCRRYAAAPANRTIHSCASPSPLCSRAAQALSAPQPPPPLTRSIRAGGTKSGTKLEVCR